MFCNCCGMSYLWHLLFTALCGMQRRTCLCHEWYQVVTHTQLVVRGKYVWRSARSVEWVSGLRRWRGAYWVQFAAPTGSARDIIWYVQSTLTQGRIIVGLYSSEYKVITKYQNIRCKRAPARSLRSKCWQWFTNHEGSTTRLVARPDTPSPLSLLPVRPPDKPTEIIEVVCSNGVLGIEANGVCCEAECGTCRGFGCRNLPGGPVSWYMLSSLPSILASIGVAPFCAKLFPTWRCVPQLKPRPIVSEPHC